MRHTVARGKTNRKWKQFTHDIHMNTFYIYIFYKLWSDSDTSAVVVWTYRHSFVFWQ